MPPSFVEAGKAAYSWRTIDAELAALTYDSAWEGQEFSLTRAESAQLRTLSFASDGLTIELELTPHEVLGQISPPQAGTVRLTSDSEALGTLPIDDLGFFIVRPVPRHPFRVICVTTKGITRADGVDLPVAPTTYLGK